MYILPFPMVRVLFVQLPLEELDSTSRMLLLWDLGILRQAGTNPPARFMWTSLQKENNYSTQCYYYLQEKLCVHFLWSQKYLLTFYFYILMGKKKKKSLPQESLWKNRVRESKQGEGTIILIYSKDYPMHIKTMVW